MRINKIVQTGAKTQFGGLKEGFIKVGYHSSKELEVEKEPKKPANNGIKIEIKNFK